MVVQEVGLDGVGDDHFYNMIQSDSEKQSSSNLRSLDTNTHATCFHFVDDLLGLLPHICRAKLHPL